ncbi:MAG: 4-(cytidine 5'-diphospho)-2-C-methyl-D-erythritol kinase [Acidobacteria bacterium]|nr:4-(cytidine 5'-diphospho)-2-C-methyl-D-erythritol kinase [Acidobacteriota bacterium]
MAWTTLAPAKVNLDLRMRGLRSDGYHLVHTVLQSIAIADRLTLDVSEGPFMLTCDTPGVPTDDTNLAWRGALAMARALGRDIDGLQLHLEKHVPAEAGLGGGSADACAAARLVAAWAGHAMPDADLAAIVRPLGADVAYFAHGGTMRGEGIGDELTPMPDEPPATVVLVRPPFGVSTRDAYGWFDSGAGVAEEDVASYGNDLQAPVAAHHPSITTIVTRLRDAGARLAAMSGSGSACFGLFDPAMDVSALLAGWPAGTRVWQTPLLGRAEYGKCRECREC